MDGKQRAVGETSHRVNHKRNHNEVVQRGSGGRLGGVRWTDETRETPIHFEPLFLSDLLLCALPWLFAFASAPEYTARFHPQPLSAFAFCCRGGLEKNETFPISEQYKPTNTWD